MRHATCDNSQRISRSMIRSRNLYTYSMQMQILSHCDPNCRSFCYDVGRTGKQPERRADRQTDRQTDQYVCSKSVQLRLVIAVPVYSIICMYIRNSLRRNFWMYFVSFTGLFNLRFIYKRNSAIRNFPIKQFEL